MEINYTYKSTEELVNNQGDCPIPLSIIPNYMGINLCSVAGIEWIKQVEDGQLTQVRIYFNPENKS